MRPKTLTLSPAANAPTALELVLGPKRTFAELLTTATGIGVGVYVDVLVAVGGGVGVLVLVGVGVDVLVGSGVFDGVGVSVGKIDNASGPQPAKAAEAAVMAATSKNSRRVSLGAPSFLLTA